jgi:methylglyoxal synthase
MGASIVEKKVNMLIFFWDPLELMPHDPDIKALLRVATMWNISKTILLKVLSWEKDISFVNLYPKMYTN